ncbi:MAG: 50S ribosomal protein L11 methyltransferase [Taibaiella sp.]|nr:50S ribosomal protein L11 methyltransferase [Taibaiella sp.]
MNNYKEVDIKVDDTVQGEMLIALLAEQGYEGFEEREGSLRAYVSADNYNADTLASLLGTHNLGYTVDELVEQNWNESWEKNFDPIVIDGFCAVRADFHKAYTDIAHEIIITPKMSFGTGHHATTQLVIMQMQKLDISGRHVLDFGTGTGILAILAEKMGAANVLAIDNDNWSYENAIENVSKNNCHVIAVKLCTLDDIPVQKYDLIIANINRHILLQYLAIMRAMLVDVGTLIISGILKTDEELMITACKQQEFTILEVSEMNGWLAITAKK